MPSPLLATLRGRNRISTSDDRLSPPSTTAPFPLRYRCAPGSFSDASGSRYFRSHCPFFRFIKTYPPPPPPKPFPNTARYTFSLSDIISSGTYHRAFSSPGTPRPSADNRFGQSMAPCFQLLPRVRKKPPRVRRASSAAFPVVGDASAVPTVAEPQSSTATLSPSPPLPRLLLAPPLHCYPVVYTFAVAEYHG